MAIITAEDKELVKKVQQPTNGNGLNTPAAGSGVEDFSGYLKEMNAAKQRAAVAGLEAAYQKNVASIDRAKESAAVEHQAARNQTAGASEQAKRNFAQYAAANGLNSGTGGQAELARSVALQNDLNAINRQEADTVADLDLQRAQTEIDYNNAIAQAQAEGDYELANALYQEKIRVQEATREEDRYREQFNYTKERDDAADDQWQQTFDYGKEQTAKDTLAGYGQAYLESGIMPSPEMLTAMGITEADARAYINNYQSNESKSQNEAQKKTLAGYGQAYLESGIMPSPEMLTAMGITEADARAYINNYQSNESKSQSEAQKKTLAGYGQAYLESGIMPSPEMLTAMGITEADARAYINNYQSNESKSQNEAQKKTLASYGAAYLEAGVMPSPEMLTAMGITEADAQVYITAVKGANADPGVESAMNLTTAKQAAENGIFNDQVIAVLKANGYTDDMLAGIYGYEAPAAAGSIDGKTIEEYDAAAGNYSSVKTLADSMKAGGATTSEILAMLKEARDTGALNTNDYMSLVNKYRG